MYFFLSLSLYFCSYDKHQFHHILLLFQTLLEIHYNIIAIDVIHFNCQSRFGVFLTVKSAHSAQLNSILSFHLLVLEWENKKILSKIYQQLRELTTFLRFRFYFSNDNRLNGLSKPTLRNFYLGRKREQNFKCDQMRAQFRTN